MNPKKALWLLCVMAPLAGCGGDEPPPGPVSYAPLHYEYLRKLRLDVGSIDVQDHSVPLGSNDVANQSPVTLAQAAVQMGHDRLFPAGMAGQAQFVVDQASIMRGPNGVLDGLLAVHLSLFNAAGVQTGFAQARVTREHIPGSDPENTQNELYDMTRDMMKDMNVELEFQIRRTLRNELVTGEPVPAPVTVAPLDNPASVPLPPPAAVPPPYGQQPPYGAQPPYGEQPPYGGQPAPGATMPPSEQPPPPQQMSPPPGYLELPPGVLPQ